MQERRRTARTRVFRAAHLITPDRHSMIECTVRDLSAGGACLQVASPLGIPEFLDLSFDSFRSFRRCRVRWRSENRLGVAFRSGTSAQAGVGTDFSD
jgi:PilZ domain